MKERSLLLGIISMVIWAGGCKQTDEKFISEGEIEYEATVIDQTNPMATMAPDQLIIKFKANKSCAEMSAGMGLFSTSFISDPQKKTVTHLLKILNKKYLLVQDETSINKENAHFPVALIPTQETKDIAGYKCIKTHVIPADKKIAPFDIYYTTELNIKTSNFSNPFYRIDGVLMEYQMEKFGLEMKFVAKSVRKVPVDDKCFMIPPDYKKVTEKEMKAIFDNLQEY